MTALSLHIPDVKDKSPVEIAEYIVSMGLIPAAVAKLLNTEATISGLQSFIESVGKEADRCNFHTKLVDPSATRSPPLSVVGMFGYSSILSRLWRELTKLTILVGNDTDGYAGYVQAPPGTLPRGSLPGLVNPPISVFHIHPIEGAGPYSWAPRVLDIPNKTSLYAGILNAVPSAVIAIDKSLATEAEAALFARPTYGPHIDVRTLKYGTVDIYCAFASGLMPRAYGSDIVLRNSPLGGFNLNRPGVTDLGAVALTTLSVLQMYHNANALQASDLLAAASRLRGCDMKGFGFDDIGEVSLYSLSR